MRKFISLVLTLPIALVVLLFFVPNTFGASQFMSGESVTLGREETITGDYFSAGEQVIIAGTVNGDAYVAGGNVTVEGTINGDLLAAGGTVTVRGRVTGDIRAAGGTVTITGEVGQNTTVAGGTVTLADNARLGGSVVSAGGSISIYAPVARDITVAGGSVVLGNTVAGNVTTGAGQITLTPAAAISGNLDAWSENEPRIENGASVSGQVRRYQPPAKLDSRDAEEAAEKTAGAFSWGWTIASFVSALIIGLLMVRFFPNYVLKTAEVTRQKPLLSFGVGVGILIITPIVILILMITLLGIPLALVLLLGYFLILYFAKIYAAVYLGQLLSGYFKRPMNIGWMFLMGLLTYYLISIIPIVGGIVTFILGMMGIGSMVIMKRNLYNQLRSEPTKSKRL